MFLEAVRETIERYGMLTRGDRVLVAVSGGADSVALLHVFRRLADEFDLTISVAHLDHGWRGEESTEDARFVQGVADEAGLEAILEHVDDAVFEAHGGLGREGAARIVRRSFLMETARSIKATRIALGHTATDRAETVLFNLTRGAGRAGIAGIPPVNGPFIRPLIGLTRDEVRDFAASEGLSWREDPTNEDVAFARNRIRHRVMPELVELNPRAVETICRAADHAADAAHIERHLAQTLWPDVIVLEEPNDIRLNRSALADLPREVLAVVLREAFFRARGDLDGIGRDHAEAVADLVHGGREHADAHLPRLYARAEGETITLSTAPFPSSPAWEFPLDLGDADLPQLGLTLALEIVDRDACKIDADDRAVEAADADCIRLPLSLRNRRVGDRFTPLGMEFPIKLKDFLINERIPYSERDDVPLLCDRERILWVVGRRLSNDVRITEATRRVLVMRTEGVA